MLNILFVHDGVLPVTLYGGIERVLYWQIKALLSLGARCTLIARPGTKVEGAHLIEHDFATDWRLKIPSGERFDLAHLFFPYDDDLPMPRILSIGGNGKPSENFHENAVFASMNHALRHGSTRFIYNGIDFSEYQVVPNLPKRDGFAFLAKARWDVKNLAGAREACQKANQTLHVMGGTGITWPWRKEKFYGMADTATKVQVLNAVKALIFPVRWHEPFGLAVVEAMACGAPVIASSYGSLPELVTHETGLLVKSQTGLIQAVAAFPASRFPATTVRELAFERFSHLKMARDYLGLYEKVMRGEALNSKPPRTVSGVKAETLLPL